MTRLTIALLCLALTSGCGNDCETDDPEDPVTFDGGNHIGTTTYETSSWEGPFLHFPPGRRLIVRHGLGAPPEVKSYLSFSEKGLNDANNVAESAGNQLVIEVVNADVVQVRNDSCAEFYVRLVATITPDAGVLDASVSD